MGHAVYHRTASGEAQLEDVSSLEAALELVERLRNEDGPTDVRLVKEIPVEVRTYYKVVAKDETEQSAPEVVATATDESPGEEAPAADDLPDGEAATDDASLEDKTVDADSDSDSDDVETDGISDDVVTDDVTTEEPEELEDAVASTDEPELAEDELPAPPVSGPSEPPAGAMPLLSPPPSVTVHGDETDAQPAAASSGRPKLFNRG